MKLAFSTLGCPDWALARVIDAAGRYGYDGLELRFLEGDDALWARPELSGPALRDTRARLRDAGLEVACVDTRSCLHDPRGAAREKALEDARRFLELAAELGAGGIRLFGDRVQPGQDQGTTRALIADGLQRLAALARPLGVEVWLESHGDFALAPETLGALEGLDPAAAGVIWDPANAFERGESPADGLRVLGDRVRHVHLKDVARDDGGEGRWVPRLPGHGTFEPARVLALLREAGYDRWVSFEWEKRWHPAIEEPELALPYFVRWASGELRGHRRPPAAGPAAPVRTLSRGRLDVEVHADRPSMGRAAARLVADHLRAEVEEHGRAAAIFASAPSQNEFLAALREEAGVPWPRITAFHLDEYIGVDAAHPASFRRFLVDRLFAHVPVTAFHGLDGLHPDPAAECARYAALLQAERPSLAVLGIGENAHLAFIDPPMCDFFDPALVRVVELDEPCRRQQVNDGSFATLEEVPRTALSLTIPYLMRVPRVVPIVPGPAKRAAVAATLDGPVTCACPASILKRHPEGRLFVDEASIAFVS